MVAVEEERMNNPMFWPAVAAAAWGFACYAVFYGAAVLIEHRQNRRRRMHLRSSLHG
jgi:hypothetical protein